MDKFLNKSREAELEPNQNNVFPEEIPSTSSGQKKAKTVMWRKHNKSYLSFEFTFTVDATKLTPLCVVCGEKHAAVLWSQANLHAICKRKHQLQENKPAVYFLRLIKHIEKQASFMNKTAKNK